MRDHVLPIVTRAAADYENARWLAAHKAAVSMEGGAGRSERVTTTFVPSPSSSGSPSVEAAA